MKQQVTFKKWANGFLILFSAITMMACSKNGGTSAPVSTGIGFNGIGGNCVGCSGFNPNGPTLFQGAATDPARGAFQMVSAQVIGDPQGYQAVAASGLRPLVNGSYAAAVAGVFRLNVPVACGSVTYPQGDYSIQMLAMGQNSDHGFYAPQVALVGPVSIQPAAINAIWVDANLDNVADRGSLFRVGFCGVWFDMNTL